ncbi:DUF4357 domain-containing protein [Olleya sp. HaHaR_3_96]|nr:DUF4357 domain-containing protein [Olleya sp. HaHaR_3_96]QXP58374.1 DUF4357 domain-containing protein [Olleya sp. HaHaR_3_96]
MYKVNNVFVFKIGLHFNSPSAIILERITNGWMSWKD